MLIALRKEENNQNRNKTEVKNTATSAPMKQPMKEATKRETKEHTFEPRDTRVTSRMTRKTRLGLFVVHRIARFGFARQ